MIRSLVFTSLLDLSPEFGRMESRKGSEVITALVADYEALPVSAETPDIYAYTKTWLTTHPMSDFERTEA